MRLYKLPSALAAAVSLLAAAPGGVLAAKHPSPRARCRVSINVVPREITAGDSATIFGRLWCPFHRHANQVVKLFHHLPGQFGFSYVQSTVTDANGFYQLQRPDRVVLTNRSWFVRSRGAQSGSKSIRVAAQVTLSGPPSSSPLQTGQPATFTGAAYPPDVGARVILQRQNASIGGDEWVRINRGQDIRVAADGKFTLPHTFVVPGDANIRVLVLSQGRNVPSPSNALNYVVDQTQNPNLTINASIDPIAFGQSVTVSGTLAMGASLPVTLYTRTDRQGFAPVAQTTSDNNGNFSFPPQSPLNSTFYRVQGAGRKSAVLFEGVRDVLTASVSATSVPVGQPVSFSGAVSPDHSGHVIYLERQNANSGDFHVIAVARVLSGSTYSIVHQFYDTGTRTVRVLIPGGPENEARPARRSRSP